MKFRTVIRLWFWAFALTSLLAVGTATYFALHPADMHRLLDHINKAPTKQTL